MSPVSPSISICNDQNQKSLVNIEIHLLKLFLLLQQQVVRKQFPRNQPTNKPLIPLRRGRLQKFLLFFPQIGNHSATHSLTTLLELLLAWLGRNSCHHRSRKPWSSLQTNESTTRLYKYKISQFYTAYLLFRYISKIPSDYIYTSPVKRHTQWWRPLL